MGRGRGAAVGGRGVGVVAIGGLVIRTIVVGDSGGLQPIKRATLKIQLTHKAVKRHMGYPCCNLKRNHSSHGNSMDHVETATFGSR